MKKSNPVALIKPLRRKLLAWYARHARDLPWRRTRDPYAVWVSEIMLQQTQVATVIPYFARWMRRFPTVRRLAAADEADVLKAWEGLGYYSRARNLHRAAKEVVARYGGRLPRDVAALRALRGIGRYTAGAIASIAFGLDEPVLDGNVIRVLCRVFRIRQNPKAAPTRKRLWSLAEDLLPKGRASEFNQALMDLGATVCTPRDPRCDACPLAALCGANARGEQAKLPAMPTRKRTPHYDIAVGVIRRGDRILIARRPSEGLLGGLWEFPGGKTESGETPEQAVVREAAEEVGIAVRVEAPLTTVKHAYSHFRVTLHVFLCRHVRGRPQPIECDATKWITPAQLDAHAFPTANRKIFPALRRALAPPTNLDPTSPCHKSLCDNV